MDRYKLLVIGLIIVVGIFLAMSFLGGGKTPGENATEKEQEDNAVEGNETDEVVTNTTGEKVSTCKELQEIKDNPNGDYYLAKDVDCSETKNWNNGKGFEPIGEMQSGERFTGTFNGNGYSIKDFYMNRSSLKSGLFGYIGLGGKARDLELEQAHIVGGGISYAGAIAGSSKGEIENVEVTGEVDCLTGLCGGAVGANNEEGTVIDVSFKGVVDALKGNGSSIGGLVGNNYGLIEDSHSNVTVKGKTGYKEGRTGVGGLVGQNDGEVTYSYSIADVTGYTSVGGLIGNSFEGNVSNSYSKGVVKGNDTSGGLIGYHVHPARVSESYSIAKVNATDYVGGLVGKSEGLEEEESYIVNCYAAGSVYNSAGEYTGGLVGKNQGVIEKSYAATDVSYSGPEAWVEDVGMFVGNNERGSCSDSFWLDEGSEYPGCGRVDCSSCKLQSNNEEAMKTKSTYTDAGWDFNTVWYMDGYPHLQWEKN